MYDWITNWLIVGLTLNWLGLMVEKYAPHAVPPNNRVSWWMEIVGICIWPVAFAAGILAAIVSRRKRK